MLTRIVDLGILMAYEIGNIINHLIFGKMDISAGVIKEDF